MTATTSCGSPRAWSRAKPILLIYPPNFPMGQELRFGDSESIRGANQEGRRTMSAMPQLKGVERFYTKGNQKVHVLSELDLEIPSGDFLALMGPSGSGKTTLLNLLGGLDRPTGGSVEVGGHRIDQLSNSALAKWR